MVKTTEQLKKALDDDSYIEVTTTHAVVHGIVLEVGAETFKMRRWEIGVADRGHWYGKLEDVKKVRVLD